MLVAKICLTGGPCAGKSTALSEIERELTDQGYKVFIINEVATRLINAGIKPFEEDAIDMLEFEEIMLKEQLVEEECFEKAANLLNKKCVILCDRGIFDIKSFLANKKFDNLISKYNLSKLNLMDNYNLVIHMNTAAKGKEEFYTTDNNKARSEGIKDAIIRDNKCQEAWSFHNNLKIVNNNTNFDDKIQKVVDIIKSYLGIEKRNERKYLVDVDDKVYEELKKKECIKIDIIQTYLKTTNDYEMRLRKRTLDSDSTYYVTVKKNNYGKEKIVTEEKIDKKTYERLMNQKDIVNVVKKKRICFVNDDNVYKLDCFEDGIYILEANEETIIPPFINVIEDVTLNDDYYNINIRNKGNRLIKKDDR